MIVTFIHFHPSLIFVGKARSLPILDKMNLSVANISNLVYKLGGAPMSRLLTALANKVHSFMIFFTNLSTFYGHKVSNFTAVNMYIYVCKFTESRYKKTVNIGATQ